MTDEQIASQCADHLAFFKAANSLGNLDGVNYEDFKNFINHNLVNNYANLGVRAALIINNLGNATNSSIALDPLIRDIKHWRQSYVDMVAIKDNALLIKCLIKEVAIVNKYFEAWAPWRMVGDVKHDAQTIHVCSVTLNVYYLVTKHLQHLIPNIAEKARLGLNVESLAWGDSPELLIKHTLGDIKKITSRVGD